MTSPRYCGTNFDCRGATNAAAGTPDATVCTGVKPFKIGVHSDGVEYAHAITVNEATEPNNAGFSLNFFQRSSCVYHDSSVA